MAQRMVFSCDCCGVEVQKNERVRFVVGLESDGVEMVDDYQEYDLCSVCKGSAISCYLSHSRSYEPAIQFVDIIKSMKKT